MHRGRLEAQSLYAAYRNMGLLYGPAHQGVHNIELGTGELLAHLTLPDAVAAQMSLFTLHPSVLDSALQAALYLTFDLNVLPHVVSLPFALSSLRILGRCAREMLAWARFAQGSGLDDEVVKLDVDVCDEEGNVCIQIQGLTGRSPANAESAGRALKAAAEFDADFYREVIDRVIGNRVSVEDAAQMG
jgi:hypothetical protein